MEKLIVKCPFPGKLRSRNVNNGLNNDEKEEKSRDSEKRMRNGENM